MLTSEVLLGKQEVTTESRESWGTATDAQQGQACGAVDQFAQLTSLWGLCSKAPSQASPTIPGSFCLHSRQILYFRGLAVPFLDARSPTAFL